jgi:hypothetical protein
MESRIELLNRGEPNAKAPKADGAWVWALWVVWAGAAVVGAINATRGLLNATFS